MEAGTNRNGAARTALLSLPAIAAVGLGLIYAAGALLNGVSLRDADRPAGDTFPLIPIEDHLSRGLQVLVSLEALLIYLMVALAFVVVANAPPARGRRQPPLGHFLKEHKRVRQVVLLTVVVVYLMAMLLRPLPFVVAALTLVVIFGIILRFGEERWQLELDPGAETGAEDRGRLAHFVQRMRRTHHRLESSLVQLARGCWLSSLPRQ